MHLLRRELILKGLHRGGQPGESLQGLRPNFCMFQPLFCHHFLEMLTKATVTSFFILLERKHFRKGGKSKERAREETIGMVLEKTDPEMRGPEMRTIAEF